MHIACQPPEGWRARTCGAWPAGCGRRPGCRTRRAHRRRAGQGVAAIRSTSLQSSLVPLASGPHRNVDRTRPSDWGRLSNGARVANKTPLRDESAARDDIDPERLMGHQAQLGCAARLAAASKVVRAASSRSSSISLSTSSSLPATKVHSKSISVDTNQARSAGHHRPAALRW